MASPPSHEVVSNDLNIVKRKLKIMHMANGPPIILNKEEGIPECITEILSEPSTSQIPSSTDFTIYENRLKSFEVNWKLDFIKPDQLAKAGFYFLGKQDRVRCAFCSKGFEDWQCDDKPSFVHKNQSPKCPFFRKSQCYDVCGNFDSSSINPNSVEENDVYQIKTPTHQNFITLEARLKSFDKCNKKLNQDINTLCEAGFLYIGNGENDQTACFYCSQGLIDWEDDDEPWTEHARFSPNCIFLLLSKGRDFVDKVYRLKNSRQSINQEELSKSIADHEDGSFLENSNIKTHPTERKNSSLPQHNISVSDSLLCKICYKKKMEIAFIPCKHVLACIQCATTIELCAVCRQSFKAMKVEIYMDPEQKQNDQLQGSSSVCSKGESNKQILCKICRKEEMAVVFMPCKHIYACVKCTIQIGECPICTKPIYYTLQVYL
ncbi:Zinc finger, RING-type,Zinc finger, RING/FYVE/PHD-type,BIR repeat [Cinara cedri]|uniref:Zinc finger, RING-type,Zinc finger, RING/FYVE/PHD-type,BIR repeat n=1 Tax=Cinara cedri TaxID=506608 RepID=A0A5E4MBA8_9HEMI|nr:Zinc finger, RING-type,Zinc finger, RING/FYVE/PHD-type,BIR repeat [Cinara cedri]